MRGISCFLLCLSLLGVSACGPSVVVTSAASAGASFHAAIRIGKFQGMI